MHLIRRSIVAFAGCLILSSSIQAAVPPLYREVRSFTNQTVELKDFNNSGDAVVNFADPGEPTVPAVLRGSTIQRLSAAGNALVTRMYVEGISNRRADGSVLVTGNAGMSDGFDRAALWTVSADGSHSLRIAPNVVLPPDSQAPGEQRIGSGHAVNTAGTMVGAGSSHITGFALRWSPPHDTAVRYLQAGSFVDINESGLMLANAVEFDHGGELNRYTGALMSFDGTPTEVPLLVKEPGAISVNILETFSGEWVVGSTYIQGKMRAVAWRMGTAASQNLPNPAYASEAENLEGQGINASGTAVGRINGGPQSGDAILWAQENGTFTGHRFGDLLSENFFDHGTVQVLINDAGQVALQSQGFSDAILRIFEPVTDGIVQFETSSDSREEGTGPMTFTVKLTRAPGNNGPVTVNFQTSDETATAPQNYTAINGSITWAAGESGLKSILVPITNNQQFDEGKTFKLRMTSATGAQLGRRTEGAGYIYDPFQQVRARNQITTELFTVAVAVLSGQSQVIVQLERTGGTDGRLTVTNFRGADNTAQAGVDYQIPANLSLEWAAGEGGIKTVAFPLLNNGAATQNKDFSLFADAILEGASFQSQVYATVVILSGPDRSQPEIKTDLLSLLAGKLPINATGVQGTTLELLKATALEGPYLKVAEATFANGEVSFQADIDTAPGAGFFRIRVRE